MNITHVVVHCSDSPAGRGDTAATIHSWHKEKGWDGIGYHHVILEDGTVQNGRPHYWHGAHVKGYNHCSIGICLIGKPNMEGTIDAYPEEQITALRRTIRQIDSVDVYSERAGAKVLGHRDLDSSKTCPGFDVSEWWAGVKDQY